MSFIARAGERFFHYLFTVTLLVGAIAYYAIASDLAYVVVHQANRTGYGDRQIFWPKYVYWVVSWPAIILALGIPSGIPWTTILYQISLSWIWAIGYLIAAFTPSNYKWGFFAFGTLAYILLAASTLTDGRAGAARLGIARDFSLLAGWVNLLWLLYPIAWGVSDGGNRIGVTPSFIFFGILDLLLVPLVAFATLFLARNWDYSRLNLAFTQYGRVNASPGTFPEKAAGHQPGTAAAPAGGVANNEPAP